jgi:tRNA(Ile)-lysidine synthase
MIKKEILQLLKAKKNLLAFSAGTDSTALFFLLLQNGVEFDIAIVDYGIRSQSKQELDYAQELAKKYQLRCHLHVAPKISQNFEAKARELRYSFFEKLIDEQKYDNLLTAHHLGDRLEWMLMQFCKGAGCVELSGMQSVQNRGSYKLIRPLLHVDKSELKNYLQKNTIKYFEDETNLDESIKRNSFRHRYAQPLLQNYLDGIKKSFEYMDEDRGSLISEIEVKSIKDFAYFKNTHNDRQNIYMIDKYLKTQLYMMSAHERDLLKSKNTLVVGRKFVINKREDYVFIAPFVDEDVKLPKEFKEQMRTLHVEPKLRKYLYKSPEVLESFLSLVSE